MTYNKLILNTNEIKKTLKANLVGEIVKKDKNFSG
jgi:hypothetical protein